MRGNYPKPTRVRKIGMSLFYSKERTHSLYSWTLAAVFLVIVAGGGCTSSNSHEEGEQHERQLKKLAELEKENEILEGKIKDAGNDPGLRYNLVSDQELLKSRIERMRENLHIVGAPSHSAPAEEKKEASHEKAASH